jgi:hypothetical protein
LQDRAELRLAFIIGVIVAVILVALVGRFVGRNRQTGARI